MVRKPVGDKLVDIDERIDTILCSGTAVIAQAPPRWAIAENIRHDLLPGACESWEAKGYEVFAVLPAGHGGVSGYSSLLLRKQGGVPPARSEHREFDELMRRTQPEAPRALKPEEDAGCMYPPPKGDGRYRR